MPARWLHAYLNMLPVLEAERVRLQVNTLLATNTRAMSDQGQQEFIRGLDQAATADGAPRKQRAPRATLGFLQSAGIRMTGGE